MIRSLRPRREPLRDPDAARAVERSLRYSVLDAASFSLMLGTGESYFQAFAVFLKGTLMQVGAVYSVPMFLGSVAQLLSAWAVRLFGSRKGLVVTLAAARTLLFVPLVLVPLMGPFRVWVLLALISAYFALNYLGIPAWTSWMRELVAESRRGAYFARRNGLANLVALVGVVVGGVVLSLYPRQSAWGFVLIFAVAFLGSVGSTVFLALKTEAPHEERRRSGESLLRFTVGLGRSNFGRFVLFNGLLHFGVFLAGPFFVPYMLGTLGFSYLQFMVSTSLVVALKFLAMPLWGELADRYGNRKVLALASVLVALVPFGWMAGRSFWWICVIQGIGGVAWAGFDIAALNFAYDLMPAEKVTRYTSFNNFYKGLAIFAGGLVGGFLLHRLELFGSAFQALFAVSGAFRVVFAIPLLRVLKEVREVEHISYRDLMFRLVSMGPRRGVQLFVIGRKKGGSTGG
ncbi:MAG: MFS transporter [Spirochaetales bacterium]|nr:MFS transporter [Spirochaetales bacterium]